MNMHTEIHWTQTQNEQGFNHLTFKKKKLSEKSPQSAENSAAHGQCTAWRTECSP